MTLQKFFIGRGIVFSILIIAGLGVLAYQYFSSPAPVIVPVSSLEEESNEPKEPPVFTWRFEEALTLNPDGNPQTKVFLTATYENGKVESKLIKTTDGGCNELPDRDTDSAPYTESVQCYYAGLGYRFKITEGEGAYLVWQKEFEEGSPDYIPPEQEYQKVAEFPLSSN